MPELPEIEAIKRVLEPQIKGLAVQRITASRPEVIAHPSADEFCKRIVDQMFAGIERRGKFLILCMESGDRIILHLRMTGCLLVIPADYPEENHQGMSGDKGTGLPQHAVSAGLWTWRRTLSDLRRNPLPQRDWRKKQCVLPGMSRIEA